MSKHLFQGAVVGVIGMLTLSARLLLAPLHAAGDRGLPERMTLPHLADETTSVADTTALFDGDLFGVDAESEVDERAIVSVPARATLPPIPALTLRAVVWGIAPIAVVEGIPGTSGGHLFGVGEELGGVKVAAIRPSSVRVVVRDSTWTLSLEKQ